MQFDQNPPDLLADEVYYERASTGKRFANYIIDLIVFYLFVFGFAILLAIAAPSTFNSWTRESSSLGIVDNILSLFFYAIYMSIVEALLKGRSVGKFITKTRAVNLDGTPISASTAFSRGFSRAVPFCVFSALGSVCNPWQDKWTNTMVINNVN
ncbi:MAG: RDD family protein [Niastella sp.]|uniref:RDD family protein n=1 Tax=Niastella sp. TaxID=1869183 RepID=UPI00389A0029